MLLRNRVVTGTPPGMTASYACRSQPCTPSGAVCLNGLDRVMRTGGQIAALPAQPWRQRQLIGTHQCDQHQRRPVAGRTRCQCVVSQLFSAALFHWPLTLLSCTDRAARDRIRRLSHAPGRHVPDSSVHPAPSRPFGAILDHDALCGKLIANAVGLGKVALPAHRVTRFDQ
jgi:hypothetical protein